MRIDFQFIRQARWYVSLPNDIKDLFDLTIVLCERQKDNDAELSDYSFLVFAAAKGYEGFLKHYLFQIGLINEDRYYSQRFRIGRALNPDVKTVQRDEHWLYDDLARECSEELASTIWLAWLECRNHIFHYFPGKNTRLTLDEALGRINQILLAVQATQECSLDRDKDKSDD